MKSIISFLLFNTFAFIAYGEKTSINYPDQVAHINALARNGIGINGVLQLKINGFIDDGSTGFVYEGKYIAGNQNQPVAIKFVPYAKSAHSAAEYKMFKYLKAFQRPEVEKYGIPNVYYRGEWNGFTVTALTKLDKDLASLANEEHHLQNPMDILILMRNFIIQLKYMHGRGVRHNDIKPGNIMVSGHRSFLIDFNLSTKMIDETLACTPEYAARRFPLKPRRPIDDVESFFYSMCHILRVPLPWFDPSIMERNFQEKMEISAKYKFQINTIMECIDACIADNVLKRVIYEFSKEIYTNYPFPNYNGLYNFISVEIIKLHAKGNSTLPPMFSWLTDAQKREALDTQQLRDITKIDEPSTIDFDTFVYPDVKEQGSPMERTNFFVRSIEKN